MKTLSKTLNNFTLLESDFTIISGLPAHKITYTTAGNQSEVQQTQAWTSNELDMILDSIQTSEGLDEFKKCGYVTEMNPYKVLDCYEKNKDKIK